MASIKSIALFWLLSVAGGLMLVLTMRVLCGTSAEADMNGHVRLALLLPSIVSVSPLRVSV